jgi:zinc-ribbon domain
MENNILEKNNWEIMAKFCPNCGERISHKVKFCHECGAEIKLFSVDTDERLTAYEQSEADTGSTIEEPSMVKESAEADGEEAFDENFSLYEDPAVGGDSAVAGNVMAGTAKNDARTGAAATGRKHRLSRVALFGAGIIAILLMVSATGAVLFMYSQGVPFTMQSLLLLSPVHTGISAPGNTDATCQTGINLTRSVIANATPVPVTPTPIPTTAETREEYMARTGGKYLGQSFIIDRQNVSGYKDLKVNVSVYRYRFFDAFNESGDASSGTTVYIRHLPDPGRKFLFVFVRMEMPGIDETNDPRMWGFGSSLFAVQYNGSLITEYANYSKCEPIKEMENTWTQNGDIRISDYGYTRIDSIAHPTNGDCCSDNAYLRFGRSNAWDGYIIYQVPRDASDKNLIVSASFSGFGNGWWYLYGKS